MWVRATVLHLAKCRQGADPDLPVEVNHLASPAIQLTAIDTLLASSYADNMLLVNLVWVTPSWSIELYIIMLFGSRLGEPDKCLESLNEAATAGRAIVGKRLVLAVAPHAVRLHATIL